ncbi:MAG: hypothetical protein LLF95_07475 [Bacteroidales bacterium]|nr:hypothetical protein [Bacteroidales bacterium]
MADNSIIRLLKYYILKLKSFLFSKDALSFLLFLILASGFWFVNALDKERETEIVIPVRFAGLPQNIAVTNNSSTKITLKIKDQGLNLFAYTRKNFNAITFDLGRIFYEKGEIIITPDQIRGKIARILLPSTNVLEIKPDSLIIQYEKLSVKTLPIEFDAKIDLAHQYVLSDKIYLSPSEMTVFGPKRILDALKTIKTEYVELNKLSDTTFLNCRLRPIQSVKFAATETKVSIFVEMFTEKKIQLPVLISNCPENLAVKTFPAFVSVTFNVGLSHFNSVSEKDLTVMLDYNDIAKDRKTKQKLKFINTTAFISNVRIEPQEVEYIIEIK